MDPLGICSLTDGRQLAAVCPKRILEGGVVLNDAATLVFGAGSSFVAVPEISILRTTSSDSAAHRIGKVDFLVARLDQDQCAVEFAALEVQAVYISGRSMRGPFREFLKTGHVPPGSGRRPDWRSSAQKRLVPQLALKVPVFRRWGKKFLVAVDQMFFDALPPMRTTDSLANSEVTWLVYSFLCNSGTYEMSKPRIHFTTWDDVQTALREGIAPEPHEILLDIEAKRKRQGLPILQSR